MDIASQKTDGYKGIWFTLGQIKGPHGDKYSGGLGTYTAKHVPTAVYVPEARKTFFVYGGTTAADRRHLLAMASHYDHATGRVPKPTIVHDKQGVDDPHDNPSLALDGDGHLWVFVSGRGRHRPGLTYRSLDPHSTEAFERVGEFEFTYPQPWWMPDGGFLHLFTKYTGVRELYWSTSDDGRAWAPDRKLAGMGGHYQVSVRRGATVMTAFNMHPGGNVDQRTNLYFARTDDGGQTWRAASGETLDTPLTELHNPALVRDFMSEHRLVYMKDINVDEQGNPVILLLASSDFRPGPNGAPRTWTLAHWTGGEWVFREVTQSTHNYDMGSLCIEPEGWRIVAPTEPGPQEYGTGGEMALWTSADRGRTWTRERLITRESPFNHAYARRPVNAHPDFYTFWADGDPCRFSESRLYFADRDGIHVRQLPYTMDADFAEPAPPLLWN